MSWGREWGRFEIGGGGAVVSMQRNGRNKVRFFNVTTGEQVGPEQTNIAPALVAAERAGWNRLEEVYEPEGGGAE